MSDIHIDSVARARPYGYDQAKVDSLIPPFVVDEDTRAGARSIVKLLEEFYEYSNRIGYPTYEVNHIINENDIDQTSTKYLTAIQNEIALNVPNSSYMDRTTLYKRIVHFYRFKGTKNAVDTFFRIFYNTAVEIEYSDDPWTYRIIADGLGAGWTSLFKKLVHPAGLKFLYAVIIEISNTAGSFIPESQAAAFIRKIINVFATVNDPMGITGDFAMNLRIVLSQMEKRYASFRSDYQTFAKFLDPGEVSSYLERTFEEASEEYIENGNAFPMTAFGSIIEITTSS